jgi:L-alanine-DL-glutamate epimerase-like enolase superfamily enzyme
MILAIVKALRENTESALRVDANAAWDVKTALNLIPQLEELDVEFIEQPLAKDNWEG